MTGLLKILTDIPLNDINIRLDPLFQKHAPSTKKGRGILTTKYGLLQ